MGVWIRHYEMTAGGADDYSVVGGWEGTRQEATDIILSDLNLVPPEHHDAIREGLKGDDWREAVGLYNQKHYLGNCITFYERD